MRDELRGARAKGYPRKDGPFTVIGPECFAAEDGSVLSWRGRNYVPQEGSAARTNAAMRSTEKGETMTEELPALPDATVEAAAAAIHASRSYALGTGRALWVDERDEAFDVLTAACDPALGPDRLVLGRELDEWIAHCATACDAKDDALTEIAQLRAALNEAADKLETYATWVVGPDRHAKMLRAARRAREATDGAR